VDFPSSLTLIDVDSLCLAYRDAPTKYLALSYVWGQIPDTLELNRATATALFQAGVLGRPETKAKIPKTIWDAVQLTHSLGIRYIWVDRLCIVRLPDGEYR
jgi:hypothetical protein